MTKSRGNRQPIIMIADSDEDERTLLKSILKLIGFRVVEASDGPQAIRLARLKSPDLIVLDLALPGLDGRVGLQKIRKQSSPQLPIIAVSTDETRQHRGGLS